jgi:CBS domain-containing protein
MRVQGLLRSKGTEVETIDPTATVAEVVDALVRCGIGALIVSADGEHIDGIVSERDLVQALATHGADLLGRPVAEVMTDFVHTCTAETSVNDLMALMTTERVRHVPVVDGDRLVGIVSIGDVVKSRILELEHEMQAVHEYITHGR